MWKSWMFSKLIFPFQLMGHKKQHVPIFASNLGLLEPSRGPSTPEAQPSGAGRLDSKPNQLPIVDTSKPGAGPSGSTSKNQHTLPANTPQVRHFVSPPIPHSALASQLSDPMQKLLC